MSFTKFCIFLSLLFISSVLSGSVNFNIAQESNCLQATGGCSFNNANIWENNTVPQPTDDVVISGSGLTNSTLYIYINNTATVSNLKINNVILAVNNNATFMIQYNGELNLGDNSELIVESYVVVNGDTQMNMFNNTAITVHGLFVVTGTTYLFGNLTAYAGSSLQLTDVVCDPEEYNVDPAATIKFDTILVLPFAVLSFPYGLNLSAINLGFNASVTVSNYFYADYLIVNQYSIFSAYDADVSIGNATGSILGDGEINIYDSSVNISADNAVIFDGFLLVDSCNVTLKQLHVNDLVISPPTTIQVDGVVLGGLTLIPGDITVVGSGLTISGNLTVMLEMNVAGAQVTVNSNSVLSAYSVFLQNGSSITTQGLISVIKPVVVTSASSFVSSASSNFYGTLVNQGQLTLSSPLAVFGSVSLADSSTLNVVLTDAKVAILVIHNGTLSVNGGIYYTMPDTPFYKKSVKYLVAQATDSASITGTFTANAAHASQNSDLHRDLSVSVSTQTITIDYTFSPKDVKWWAWLLLSVGVVFFIIAVVLIVKTCRQRRSDYEPVR